VPQPSQIRQENRGETRQEEQEKALNTPKSDLGANRVLEALAAAQFALAKALPLDVMVTINFTAMGITEADGARTELHRFSKAMGAWLNSRRIPVVWIAAIERGPSGVLHAHIAVHVPGVTEQDNPMPDVPYRTQFRKWARETIARRIGKMVPRLVNVRCGLKQCEVAHWACVTYLLKGFDPKALLFPLLGPWHKEQISLADIMPFHYRSAGDIEGRRLFISGNLGPARRRIGMPVGSKRTLLDRGTRKNLESAPDGTCERLPSAFVSTFDRGQFDVREIYGKPFCHFVTGIDASKEKSNPKPITQEQIMKQLAGLGI
jgi:hypothetical protein